METVDAARAKYGLKSLGELRAAGAFKDILTQQKEETVDALSVVARPVDVRRLPRRTVVDSSCKVCVSCIARDGWVRLC